MLKLTGDGQTNMHGFRTSSGIVWNTDVNAAYDILAKSNENVVSELFRSREIEAFVVNPITVTYQFGENLIGCYGIGVCDYACRVKGGLPFGMMLRTLRRPDVMS